MKIKHLSSLDYKKIKRTIIKILISRILDFLPFEFVV